jgi:hypothetical protein
MQRERNAKTLSRLTNLPCELHRDSLLAMHGWVTFTASPPMVACRYRCVEDLRLRWRSPLFLIRVAHANFHASLKPRTKVYLHGIVLFRT